MKWPLNFEIKAGSAEELYDILSGTEATPDLTTIKGKLDFVNGPVLDDFDNEEKDKDPEDPKKK